MKRTIFLVVPVTFLLVAVGAFGQSPLPTPTPISDADVVKINTSVIQLDVVVTSKDGSPVTDLNKQDFQVFQDGRSQQIMSVTYIAPNTADGLSSETKRSKNEVGIPAFGTRSKQGRIITFVLDDGNCLASMEGNFNMREAIKKFVDEQMLPNDRVAIYRTRGGTSLLQMYSSDKNVLRDKIKKLSFTTAGGCNSAFQSQSTRPPGRGDPAQDPIRIQRENEQYLRERDNQLVGTLGVLSFVVDRLKASSQRSEVFLLSEGLASEAGSRSRDALHELADKAARASVVFHTLSNKGLNVPGMIEAADGASPGDTERISAQRISEDNALSGGLAYLAYTTGGSFIGNQTFLEKSVKKLLDAEKGYYLVAYEPEDSTFKSKEFHRIEVKTTRPGLNVVSRKGFFGRVEKDQAPQYKTADSPLFQAISSPFQENGINLRLTTLSGNSIKGGSFIKAMLHVPGDNIQLADAPDGKKKFAMDVVVVVLDEKAKVVSEFNRTFTMQIPPEVVPVIEKNGVDLSSDIPIAQSGLYSYRVAVRDGNSGRIGSAGEFVRLPDLKNQFAVAGLLATTFGSNGKPILPLERSTDDGFDPIVTKASPSIRQYASGSTLVYAYSVYNAKNNGTTVSLTRQIRLFRDGKMLVDSGEQAMSGSRSIDGSRIDDFGNIRISDQVAQGEYVLQVVIRDKVANKVSEQSVDFEVIP